MPFTHSADYMYYANFNTSCGNKKNIIMAVPLHIEKLITSRLDCIKAAQFLPLVSYTRGEDGMETTKSVREDLHTEGEGSLVAVEEDHAEQVLFEDFPGREVLQDGEVQVKVVEKSQKDRNTNEASSFPAFKFQPKGICFFVPFMAIERCFSIYQ